MLKPRAWVPALSGLLILAGCPAEPPAATSTVTTVRKSTPKPSASAPAAASADPGDAIIPSASPVNGVSGIEATESATPTPAADATATPTPVPTETPSPTPTPTATPEEDEDEEDEETTPVATVDTFAGAYAGYLDGSGTNALFDAPRGLAVDPAGNLYVADSGNARIRKITPDGAVTTVAGSVAGFWDASGTAALFNQPTGIAVADDGALFVADRANHAVRRIAQDGAVLTLAGGTAGFADGNGSAAQLRDPQGLALDEAGRLWVADTGNHAIRRVTEAGDVTTIAGTGAAGLADGTFGAATFNAPSDVAFDLSRRLVVADFGNQALRRLDFGSSLAAILAGDGVIGAIDGTGTGARLASPQGVAVDAQGRVWVAEAASNRLRVVTPEGGVTTIAGDAAGALDGPLTSARFSAPGDVAIARDGTVYVADTGNHRIRRIRF